MNASPTTELARFVAGTGLHDLPARVRERATIVLLDTVASAVAGGLSDEAKLIEMAARSATGSGSSPVVGRPPMSAAGAVLLNGYLVTATTVCDVYRPALCHVTPEVFPPALAVGIERRVSGADFLLAFALGLEVTTRIAKGANYPAFRARGWHSPGVFGPFGGAAAAGRLLGLDAGMLTNAFGLAGSQASGTFAHWGTPTIKFHQARGAFAGYLSAVLAATGFTAGREVLAAPDGGI
ncbi:MAG: MmgE/PrpD family protein, partial [Nocardioidaceae bacterium]